MTRAEIYNFLFKLRYTPIQEIFKNGFWEKLYRRVDKNDKKFFLLRKGIYLQNVLDFENGGRIFLTDGELKLICDVKPLGSNQLEVIYDFGLNGANPTKVFKFADIKIRDEKFSEMINQIMKEAMVQLPDSLIKKMLLIMKEERKFGGPSSIFNSVAEHTSSCPNNTFGYSVRTSFGIKPPAFIGGISKF